MATLTSMRESESILATSRKCDGDIINYVFGAMREM